jgi:hypothetical protein
MTVSGSGFGAGDAARITGVSAALQRAWRRRGIINQRTPGRHARFGIRDLVELAVLKTLSNGGASVQRSMALVGYAIWPITAHIEILSNGVGESPDQAPARYLIEWYQPDQLRTIIVSGDDLARTVETNKPDEASVLFQVLDCRAIAKRLHARLTR